MIPSLSPSLSFPLPILTAARCCCDHGWGFFVMPAVFTIGMVSRQPLLLLLLPIPLLQSLRRGRCCLGTATATIVVVIVVVAELRPLPLPSCL
ncbi:hypothetical protein EDB86DRAFT_2972843 [Lactarius hatsudake]|nr:hypothetical protein EDB86DRAFT_2972843 [Lactarius hatsudake]